MLTCRKCKPQENGQPALRTGLSYQRVESANQIQRAFIYSCGSCGRSFFIFAMDFSAVGVMMLVVGSLGCCFCCRGFCCCWYRLFVLVQDAVELLSLACESQWFRISRFVAARAWRVARLIFDHHDQFRCSFCRLNFESKNTRNFLVVRRVVWAERV